MNIVKDSALFSSLVTGAEHITFGEEGATPVRFTPAEREACLKNGGNLARVEATAGVRICFLTDSTRLSLGIFVCSELKSCFMADIYVNGTPIGSVANFNEEGKAVLADGSVDDSTKEPSAFPQGCYRGSFALGEGKKKVTIYLPYSLKTSVSELILDDGASLSPCRPSFRHLIYGDSITQGFSGNHPALTYAARLSDYLNAEGFHKGVDGAIYFPPLAAAAPERDYDFVTVAYGTNDWSRVPREEFEQNASAFLAVLAERYATAKIFVLTPLWRADAEASGRGTPADYGDFLAAVCQRYNNLRVIRCENFIPKEPRFFEDGRLHPNDEGFAHYAENLTAAIGEQLESFK